MDTMLGPPPLERAGRVDGVGAPPYYSIGEAAALLGVSRVTIWRWVRAGRLSVARLGHRTARITRADLERLLAPDEPAGARSHDLGNPLTAAATEHGAAPATWPELGASGHLVQFYEADGCLLDTVAEFIGAALRAGDAGVVVATEAHRAGIEDRLWAAGLDVTAARADGRYTSPNAAETLLRLMVEGVPEPARFAEVIGSLVAQAATGGRRVHVFGEMVALLIEQGNPAAALRLEALWNALQQTHAFTLLCGYPLAGFGAAAHAQVFSDVCASHTHVLPVESYTALADPDDRLRAIAALQQQARSLQAEVKARTRAEERVRRLQEITAQLSQSLEADRVLTAIAHAAADLLQAPVGAVFLLDRRALDGDFVLAAAHGIDATRAPDLRLPRHASLAGRAVDMGQTLVVDDVRATPGTALPALLTGQADGSEIAAPIMAGATRLGVVKAFSPTLRRFGADDAALLTALAAAAAVALTNAHLYREVREAVQVRDEFLASAAHDLKTPITAIKATAQLLQRRVARAAPAGGEHLAEPLAVIDATATAMAQQLDELLDLTRLEVGQRLELHRSPTDLVALARRLAAEQQQVTQRHRLRVDAPVGEVSGVWDAVRLGRVLENLLSNAIKYSPAGGEIVVSVTREDGTGNGWAVLAVRDPGLGIPAAELPQIFERFRRAGNVADRIGGMGIGLASARQIVEQHGGVIAVESSEGVGSTFTVRLPLGTTAGADAAAAPEHGSPPVTPGPLADRRRVDGGPADGA